MKDGTLLLATNHGIVTASMQTGCWKESGHSLEDFDVTALVIHDGVILAGTTRGVFRSIDGAHTWGETNTGLDLPHIRWIAVNGEGPHGLFAGTEPAGIFVSEDGGSSWRGCPEVETLRDKHHWFLPYSPEAGCVRDFAFHGKRGYAAVEVGGVLRSDNGGETWDLALGSTGEPTFKIPPTPLVFADVHSVAVHPSSADLVFAVTAEGLYRSEDGGDTWTVSHAGSYCRAAWVNGSDANHIVLGPADSVSDKNGRIEVSYDGGRDWRSMSEGLDLPWPDRMIERFAAFDDELVAVTNDGRVYTTSLSTMRWERVLPAIEGVNAVTRLQGDPGTCQG